MSWWYPGDPGYQMQVPECLMARGRTDRGGDGDFRLGSNMHGEEIWQKDKDTMPGFLGMFCRTTLPWYFATERSRHRGEVGLVSGSRGSCLHCARGNKDAHRSRLELEAGYRAGQFIERTFTTQPPMKTNCTIALIIPLP